MSLNASKLIKVSLCILAITIAVGAMLLRQRNQLMETQVVLVKKGMSASQVIRHLKSSSIIESDKSS